MRINLDMLTDQEKNKSLISVKLMKEKRRVKIKGRLCADGILYMEYVPRYEYSSPTVSLEDLLTNIAIDAHKK